MRTFRGRNSPPLGQPNALPQSRFSETHQQLTKAEHGSIVIATRLRHKRLQIFRDPRANAANRSHSLW